LVAWTSYDRGAAGRLHSSGSAWGNAAAAVFTGSLERAATGRSDKKNVILPNGR